MILKLSDMYTIGEEDTSLELTALMLNINPDYNQELLNACKTLKDYSLYTARVREYADRMSLEDAVERAITECIKEGILSEFLLKNRAEAKRMSIYEYDEERHMRQTRAEGYEEGEAAGIKEATQRLNQLNRLLAEQNRTEDIIKAAIDENYQKKLLEEFDL